MPNAQRALGHSGLHEQHATSLHATAVTSMTAAAEEGTHTSMAAVCGLGGQDSGGVGDDALGVSLSTLQPLPPCTSAHHVVQR